MALAFRYYARDDSPIIEFARARVVPPDWFLRFVAEAGAAGPVVLDRLVAKGYSSPPHVAANNAMFYHYAHAGAHIVRPTLYRIREARALFSHGLIRGSLAVHASIEPEVLPGTFADVAGELGFPLVQASIKPWGPSLRRAGELLAGVGHRPGIDYAICPSEFSPPPGLDRHCEPDRAPNVWIAARRLDKTDYM